MRDYKRKPEDFQGFVNYKMEGDYSGLTFELTGTCIIYLLPCQSSVFVSHYYGGILITWTLTSDENAL